MALALAPLLAMGIPALLQGVSGIMGIADQAKRLHGGGLRRRRRAVHKRGGRVYRHVKKRRHIRRGKGIAADIIGSIPLLGSIAGPIVRALGGRINRKYKRHHKRIMKGRGLSPMYMSRPYVGMGMLQPVGMKTYAKNAQIVRFPQNLQALDKPISELSINPYGMNLYKAYKKGSGMRRKYKKHYKKHKQGRGLSPMYMSRPYVGMGLSPYGNYMRGTGLHKKTKYHKKRHYAGLLAPAGGAVHRKGHYRKVGHKKIRVRATIAAKPGIGGYRPYTFRTRPLLLKM